MVDSSLIRMWILGPAVSLQGSPTVSPVTAALWASEPFPPNLPVSSYFLALSQAPPPLLKKRAINIPVEVENIKNPAKASEVSHKFVDGRSHPMPGYAWMQEQEIADMVAYLQSIAPEEMSNKEVYVDACQRCHSIKYADMQKGTMAAFTPDENIKAYMGKLPPDLSQHIKSRGHAYLETFINQPQKHLEGTAMPKVGLTKDSQDQVIAYLEEVGDSSKVKREELGPKFLIYLAIFAVFAFLWKSSKWRDVH